MSEVNFISDKSPDEREDKAKKKEARDRIEWTKSMKDQAIAEVGGKKKPAGRFGLFAKKKKEEKKPNNKLNISDSRKEILRRLSQEKKASGLTNGKRIGRGKKNILSQLFQKNELPKKQKKSQAIDNRQEIITKKESKRRLKKIKREKTALNRYGQEKKKPRKKFGKNLAAKLVLFFKGLLPKKKFKRAEITDHKELFKAEKETESVKKPKVEEIKKEKAEAKTDDTPQKSFSTPTAEVNVRR